jgi:hypothetical protein
MPSASPTLKPSSQPTLQTWTIRLERIDYYSWLWYTPINLLGIDVYDTGGNFISNISTPTMSSTLDNDYAHHGAQYLIDGVHELWGADGWYRLPHTMNDYLAWVQLYFVTTKELSRVVIWNRVECCGDRTIGTRLTVRRNSDIVFQSDITDNQSTYTFVLPTAQPSLAPTRLPTTTKPTRLPTRAPLKPTAIPTRRPSRKPTRKPTPKPTSFMNASYKSCTEDTDVCIHLIFLHDAQAFTERN